MCFTSPKTGELLSCRDSAEKIFSDPHKRTFRYHILTLTQQHGPLSLGFVHRTKTIFLELLSGKTQLFHTMDKEQRKETVLQDALQDRSLGLMADQHLAMRVVTH